MWKPLIDCVTTSFDVEVRPVGSISTKEIFKANKDRVSGWTNSDGDSLVYLNTFPENYEFFKSE